MSLRVLLIQQPALNAVAFHGRKRSGGFLAIGNPFAERIYGETGHPCAKVGIDRPTAILSNRTADEINGPASDDVASLPTGSEAHRDKTGERSCLEETAALWLDLR